MTTTRGGRIHLGKFLGQDVDDSMIQLVLLRVLHDGSIPTRDRVYQYSTTFAFKYEL